MSQKVQLTWRSDDAHNTVEEVQLLLDGEFKEDGTLVEGGIQSLLEDGRVMFRDAQGIFGLKPSQIIKIKKV